MLPCERFTSPTRPPIRSPWRPDSRQEDRVPDHLPGTLGATKPAPLAGSRARSVTRTREDWTHEDWTRADWVRLADRLLMSARRFASPGHARITPPGPEGGYGRAVDGLEGFARSFLL